MVSGSLQPSDTDRIHTIGTTAYENQKRILQWLEQSETEPFPPSLIDDIRRNMEMLANWGMHT